jgi:hypothetical protein
MSVLENNKGQTVSPDNPLDVQISGGKAFDPFEGTSDTTVTFTSPAIGFVITNDHTADLTFTINGYTFRVKSGEAFEEVFREFTVAQILAVGPFRGYGKSSD